MSVLPRIALFWLLANSLVLVGCNWVKLAPEGARVAVLSAGQVEHCERIGTTTVELLDRAILERGSEKVATELETLARNGAADHANVIVASSQVENGVQTFALYQCDQNA